MVTAAGPAHGHLAARDAWDVVFHLKSRFFYQEGRAAGCVPQWCPDRLVVSAGKGGRTDLGQLPPLPPPTLLLSEGLEVVRRL